MTTPYGQQPVGGQAPQEHPQGTTIMILGIVSLFTCFIVGIVALVKSKPVLAEIDANPGAYTNRGNVQAGRICAIISIIWQAIVAVVYIIIAIVGVIAATQGS